MSNERYDDKQHVPDMASNSTGSGAECSWPLGFSGAISVFCDKPKGHDNNVHLLKPSGPVCRHCGAELYFVAGYWQTAKLPKNGGRYCKEHDGRHEPAQAGQPHEAEEEWRPCSQVINETCKTPQVCNDRGCQMAVAASPSSAEQPLYSEAELKTEGLRASMIDYGVEGKATMYSKAEQPRPDCTCNRTGLRETEHYGVCPVLAWGDKRLAMTPVAASPAEGPRQGEHHSVFVQELNAQIDIEVLPLVRLLNAIPGVQTISSCQGDPGAIEVHGGSYGSVTFIKGKWREVSDFCFAFIFPLFIDLWDDVRVEVIATATHGEQWEGWIRFRNESLPTIIDRLSKAAQPSAKVEEIATKIVEEFISPLYAQRPDVHEIVAQQTGEIAAILRPYFLVDAPAAEVQELRAKLLAESAGHMKTQALKAANERWMAEQDARKAAESELNPAREALRKYGHHTMIGCSLGTCICGFEAALSGTAQSSGRETKEKP